MSYLEYAESGFHIFGLYGGDDEGHCLCGNPNCKNAFKHPRTNGWQKTPLWSDDQLDVMYDMGQFDTGFGVVVRDNLFVVDVDPRNGGFESAERLPVSLRDTCTFIVATGGGGFHYYYRLPDGVSLMYKHNDYEGIEFKTSGYVVGYGSIHASGAMYEVEKGSLDTIGPAPQELIDLLKKKGSFKAEVNGAEVEVTDTEIADMLACIDPDIDYDTWIRLGMAVHHTMNGDGFTLWDAWSSKGSKYQSEIMDYKWHSFGKSSSVVTLGTLKHYAQEGGYVESVTFDAEIEVQDDPCDDDIDLSHIDLLRPPGLVGELTEWIHKQCRYPRERLAVAAALTAIGNLAGVKYKDLHYGATTNLFTFCVAGSATGKDDVMSATFDAMIKAGMGDAFNGTIKSEQEIVRALIHAPEACYVVDEIGILLAKITNASRSGASYLEGVIGMLMQVYSKCDKRMPLSFDVRKDARERVIREISAINDAKDNNLSFDQDRLDELTQLLGDLSYGLNKPFLSLIGFTTPVTFDKAVNAEQATNGFIGRSLIVQEKETNPRRSKRFAPCDMPMPLQMSLSALHDGAKRGMDKIGIPTTEDGIAMLERICEDLQDQAELMKASGLEAIARRAFELVLKVSIICAVGDGVRTVQHIEWAYAFVKADIATKTNLAAANIAQEFKANDEALMRKIINQLDEDEGLTQGVLINRMRPFKKDDVIAALDKLEGAGIISKSSASKTSKGGRPSVKYFAKDVSKVMTIH